MDTIDFDAYLWSLLGHYPFPWKIEMLSVPRNSAATFQSYLISSENGHSFLKHVSNYETLASLLEAVCQIASGWKQDVL